MHDSFAALLSQPTARRYKQLRSPVLAEVTSDFSLRLAALQQALSEAEANVDELSTAIAIAAELLPAGLLSLRLHRLGGELALKRGDTQRAKLHRFTYSSLLQAIESTGDGTKRRPLLITYSSDGEEILAARGFRVVSQSLVEDAQRRFDVLLCDDEREYWFDVTDLLPVTAMVVERKQRPSATTSARPVRKRVVSRR